MSSSVDSPKLDPHSHPHPDDLVESLAVIFSVSGVVLSEAERSFFTRVRPFGFILFARNCQDRDSVRALSDSLRACVGWDCPILIDQEGGRVQRLAPPVWDSFPPMQYFGTRARDAGLCLAQDELRRTIHAIAHDLTQAGVNVDCAPVLDVAHACTHGVIGDRAFSDDPAHVGALGLCACEAFLSCGITPVIKHIPGHGLAQHDTHTDLARVEACEGDLMRDIAPFAHVARAPIGGRVWAMTAHVLYTAWDDLRCASVSPRIIQDVIRDRIGFQGILLSDDLSMGALDSIGDLPARADAVLRAGCDLALYCAGHLPDMEALADSVPHLSPQILARFAPDQTCFRAQG